MEGLRGLRDLYYFGLTASLYEDTNALISDSEISSYFSRIILKLGLWFVISPLIYIVPLVVILLLGFPIASKN